MWFVLERRSTMFPNKTERQRMSRGLWVVILGPDGVGKSAVIAMLRERPLWNYAGCESFHLRPGLFVTSKATVNSRPHGQAARGFVITVVKLLYLLTANWITYVATTRARRQKGTLVLYDRYFIDCLVDPQRYRLPLSCYALAQWVAQRMPQPDAWIVMDAPGHTLQERKSEVSRAESERQRLEYVRLAASRPHAYVVNAAQPLSQVVDAVVQCIFDRRSDCARMRQAS